MTRTQILLGEDRASALAHYPHAVSVGDLIFISGISSRRADNTHDGVTIRSDDVVEKDVRAQTRAVFDNIAHILAAAGLTLAHVVDCTVFLVDMADYKAMNEVYNTFFTKERGPARTTVAVKELPHPNLLIEVKAIASRSAA